MDADERYVVNPDVSCREEGPDGALLFNPDTDEVLVINTTGLLVWQALKEPAQKEAVVAALKAQCDNVPEDTVGQDVEEFIDEMLRRGFVGVYKGTVKLGR